MSKPVEFIEVYESVSDDTEGRQFGTGLIWETFHLAKAASSRTLAPPEPITHKAVRLDDGRAWILKGEPTPFYKSIEQAKRQAALAKLTAEERTLLGVG